MSKVDYRGLLLFCFVFENEKFIRWLFLHICWWWDVYFLILCIWHFHLIRSHTKLILDCNLESCDSGPVFLNRWFATNFLVIGTYFWVAGTSEFNSDKRKDCVLFCFMARQYTNVENHCQLVKNINRDLKLNFLQIQCPPLNRITDKRISCLLCSNNASSINLNKK
jgi:hypothetical protein